MNLQYERDDQSDEETLSILLDLAENWSGECFRRFNRAVRNVESELSVEQELVSDGERTAASAARYVVCRVADVLVLLQEGGVVELYERFRAEYHEPLPDRSRNCLAETLGAILRREPLPGTPGSPRDSTPAPWPEIYHEFESSQCLCNGLRQLDVQQLKAGNHQILALILFENVGARLTQEFSAALQQRKHGVSTILRKKRQAGHPKNSSGTGVSGQSTEPTTERVDLIRDIVIARDGSPTYAAITKELRRRTGIGIRKQQLTMILRYSQG